MRFSTKELEFLSELLHDLYGDWMPSMAEDIQSKLHAELAQRYQARVEEKLNG